MHNADVAGVFRERLEECMKSQGLSRSSLAAKLNEHFGTGYTHNDVRRWLATGNKAVKQSLKNKDGTVSFPKMETIMCLASFFDVDIGYLLGETDMKSFSMEKACAFTGLDSDAITNIRDITQPEIKNPMPMRFDMRHVLCLFLSSPDFKEFFAHLHGLYSCSSVSGRIPDVFPCEEEARGYVIDCNESASLNRYKINEALVHLMDNTFPYMTMQDVDVEEEW